MAVSGAGTGPGEGWAFGLLGDLHVVCDGQPQPSPPHRTRGLLALLLLRPEVRRRERLATILFPDLDTSLGRRRLSDLLWLLHAALPGLPLQISPDEILLAPTIRWLDVEAFQQHSAGASLADWQRALDLYRGDLCDGSYDEWLTTEREVLYLRYVRTAHHAGEAWLQSGSAERAVACLERLTRSEPFDERALRTLMRAYHAVGRRGAAISAYERFARLAYDELRAEPEEATRALAQLVRVATHAARPAPVAACGGDPGDLAREGRASLAQGDWKRVELCLDALRDASTSPSEALALLEVDLALARYHIPSARAALARIAAAYTAPGLLPSPALHVRSAALALAGHDLATAIGLASEALLAAHQTRDHDTQLEALCTLIRAHQQLGQEAHATRLAARAVSLARASDKPDHLARALILSGRSRANQGQYAQALTDLAEARAIALERGLRYYLVAALAVVRLAQCNTNRVGDARHTVEEELSLSRDLGLKYQEAEALEGLALVEDLSGRSHDSLRALERAHAISQAIGDPVRLATNQYNLACTLIYQCDSQAPRAIAEARQALRIYRAHNHPGQAGTLTILGYALWVNEEYAASLTALEEAITACERSGQHNRLPELLAYQGLAHLGAGDAAAALESTHQAVLALTQEEVSQEVVPDVYYAHATALAASGLARDARVVLTQAYDCLLEGAADIEDEAARQAYFQRSPTTRRLMRDLQDSGLTIAPSEGTITRQLAVQQGRRMVRVVWTVDAGPPDMALGRGRGTIALRRSRLTRLLREAQVQGARPTVRQLAEALGASERTIQRDLAALRGLAAGSEPPTASDVIRHRPAGAQSRSPR